MMFIDLDNFKQVNDNMGHDKGDDALRSCADFLKEHIRRSDDIFRFGGDEFIVLLYGAKEQEASMLCEKLENLFLNSTIAKSYNIGMSIGYKEYGGEEGDIFFKQTDEEMYHKKRERKARR
ncbi:MAG TPA: GGDEF domain-containing protein, partial [Sulfurimonas sp.]